MHTIKSIMKNCRKRSWSLILICICLGISLGFIQRVVGASLNENMKKMIVAFVTKEESPFSRNMVEFFTNQYNMEIQEGTSYNDYTSDLLDRKISAIIELPEGYYDQCIEQKKSLPVQLTTIDNYENEAYLTSYINTYLSNLQVIFETANGDETMCSSMIGQLKIPAITVIGAEDALSEKSINQEGFTLTIGFFLNFVWVIGIFLALNINSDRSDGTLTRVQGTAVNGLQYMLGMVMYYSMVGVMAPILYLAYMKLNNVNFGFSYGYAFLLMLLMEFIVIGLSIILSFILKSKVAVIAAVYSIGAVMAIIGGAYFEIDGINGTLGRIIRLTPTYYIMDSVRKLQSVKNFNPSFNIVILSLFALLSILAAIAIYSKKADMGEK